MKYYKYLAKERVDGFFQKPRLRFSPIAELNDPFEVRPRLNHIRDPRFLDSIVASAKAEIMLQRTFEGIKQNKSFPVSYEP